MLPLSRLGGPPKKATGKKNCSSESQDRPGSTCRGTLTASIQPSRLVPFPHSLPGRRLVTRLDTHLDTLHDRLLHKQKEKNGAWRALSHCSLSSVLFLFSSHPHFFTNHRKSPIQDKLPKPPVSSSLSLFLPSSASPSFAPQSRPSLSVQPLPPPETTQTTECCCQPYKQQRPRPVVVAALRCSSKIDSSRFLHLCVKTPRRLRFGN